LVARAATADRHPEDHDAQDARRRAGADAASAGGWRERPTWRYVTAQLAEAAAGADTVDVAIALRMVLMLEGVECRPQ